VQENVLALLAELPPNVELEAAAKGQPPEKIIAAIEAGVRIIGENYVQEALAAQAVIGRRVRWHFIGHLQKNKVKKAVEIFDMVETVDSWELAQEIEKRAAALSKVMPVLIEVNSGREPQKFGVWPENVVALALKIAQLPHLELQGLMTMGPLAGAPEEARPYFRETRRLFEELKNIELPRGAMRYLSMGMTNSYRVAVEEGANIVRIGTKIFGPRD